MSVLIEQNRVIQSVVSENLELYLSWVTRKLSELVQGPAVDLTKDEAQALYSVVKVRTLVPSCPPGSSPLYLLTLKAPITTAADDKFCDIFLNF